MAGAKGKMVVAIAGTNRDFYHGPGTLILYATGACQEVNREPNGWYIRDPNRQRTDGKAVPEQTGLYVWEGELTATLNTVNWDGTWRSITPSEALVLASGKNPLTVPVSELIDAKISNSKLLT